MDESSEISDRANGAVARGAWQEALDLLTAAQTQRSLAPSELVLLGEVSYRAGEFEAAITAWEGAHGPSPRAARTWPPRRPSRLSPSIC